MSKDQDILIRYQNLSEFFLSDIWQDLKEEINQCYANADFSLKVISCQNRAFYAGKCNGIQEILNIENVVKSYLDKAAEALQEKEVD